MTVRVLFFGATADVVGSREVNMNVGDCQTALAVLDQVTADHPRLATHKLLISINQEYAGGDEVIRDGDEIAIFSAVSGG